MSLINCLKGAPDHIASDLKSRWEERVKKGMAEDVADREVLKEYGEELTSRLNDARKAAGLKPVKPMYTSKKAKDINKQFDAELKKLSPVMRTVEGPTTEETEVVDDAGPAGIDLQLHAPTELDRTEVSNGIYSGSIEKLGHDQVAVSLAHEGEVPEDGSLPIESSQGKKGNKYASTRMETEKLADNIKVMYDHAMANPQKQFLVNLRVEPGTRTDGFTSKELANMFGKFPIPENVIFNEGFKALMDNDPGRFLGDMLIPDQSTRVPININEESLQKARKDQFVEILDEAGKGTGKFFSAEQQIQATDSIIYGVSIAMNRDGKRMPASQILDSIRKQYENILYKVYTPLSTGKRVTVAGKDMFPNITTENAVALKENLQNVLNSFDGLAADALKRLSLSGIKVSNLDKDENPDLNSEFKIEDGKNIESYGDLIFSLDPRTTASGELKLFMSTVEKMEEKVKSVPRKVSIPFKEDNRAAIVSGERTSTIRTPAQAKEMKLHVGELANSGVFELEGKLYKATATHALSASEAVEYNESNQREEHAAQPGDIHIAIAPYIEEKGLEPIKSFIGTPTLEDFNSMYEDVTGSLAGMNPSFKDYIAVLESSNKPALKRLAEKLQDKATPEKIRREFVTIMSKSYTEYAMLQFNELSEGTNTMVYNANLYSAKNTLKRGWQEMQKISPMVLRNASGNLVVNKEMLAELVGDYNELKVTQAKYEEAVKAKDKSRRALLAATVAQGTQLARKMFTVNGITMSDDAYRDLFNNMARHTEGTSFPGDVLRQWDVTQDGKPNGIFSAFLSAFIQAADEDASASTELQRNNPLYTEAKTMGILANVAARHAETLYNSSHRTAKGDNVWDYTLNTDLAHQFSKLVGEAPDYRNMLSSTALSKSNWLLNYWKDTGNHKYVEMHYLEALKKKYGNKSAERTEMSPRDQLFAALTLFMNQGNKSAHFMSLTHSDKTRTPVFKNLPRTQVLTTSGQWASQARERLYSLFEGEFDRIAKHADKTFDSEQYMKGKGKFFIFPEFNYENMAAAVNAGTITAAELGHIWIAPNKLNVAAKAGDGKKVVDKMLADFVNREAALQYMDFVNNGIVSPISHKFDAKYIREKIEGPARVQSIPKANMYYGISGGTRVSITKEQYNEAIGKAVAADFAINGFLANAAMSQMLYGDPAEVFKGDVPRTMTEYQKRLAGPIAPGKETEWTRPTYNSIVLDDVIVGLEYTKLQSYFKGINLTDAQELVTMQEHLDVLFHYGQLEEETYKEMSAIIKPAGYYEFEKPEHKKVVLQIMKPVYYGPRGLVGGEGGAILRDYVKSSAIPLYPPFTDGLGAIDELRKHMEVFGVQRAHYISAQKIGAIKPTQIFDKNGLTRFDAEFPARLTMKRENFRIQQDVPHDPDKQKIEVFTQMNKILPADLPESIKITTQDGRELDRDGIRKEKEAVRISMLNENLEEFVKELGINPSMQADKSKLMARIMRMAKDKGYSSNEMMPLLTKTEEGNPLSPIFFSSLADPLQSVMMSMVDHIIKTKVAGKSYVQASSAGIRQLSSVVPKGVKWIPGREAGELKMMHKDDKGVVQPAEVLVPFSFFNNGRKMLMKDFINEDGTLDMSKFPDGILDMVGVRIPTTKHNSSLPIRIAGFLPENMGDTIIVPPGITLQMGSDFDVDKLYVYRRPYSFSAVTEENTSKFELTADDQSRYFDLHWKVLTHPEMYETVMSPLDKPDLKDEAKLVAADPDASNYFAPRTQLNDFMSQKDAKNLVGFSALTNTLLAAIQHLNIRYGHTEVDQEGNVKLVDDFITLFDGKKLGKISGYGESRYNGERRTKMDNIGIMLGEFLDHAKHRTIDKINLTVHTYPAAAALMSLEDEMGSALNLQYAARMLQQPIIREFNRKMQMGSDMFSGYTANLKDSVLTQLEEDLVKKGAKSDPSLSLNEDDLLDLIKKGDRAPRYLDKQLAVLQAFRELDNIGKRMSEISSLINQDVNGTGGDLFSVLDKLDKVDTVLGNETLLDAKDVIAEGTERGWLFDHVNGLAANLFTDHLPHKILFDTMLKNIQEITGRESATLLTNDMKKGVMKAARSFVYSDLSTMGVSSATEERARLLYRTAQGPSLAQRLIQAQTSWGKNNYFLKRLRADIGDGSDPSSVSFIASKVTRMDDNENTRGFLELLTSDVPEEKLLGEDLVRYAFLTGGIQDATNFVKYIPFGYLESVGWFDNLRNKYRNLSGIFSSPAVLDQWFRHNPENAMQISQNFTETGSKIKGIPETFALPYPKVDEKNPASKFMVRDSSNQGAPTYTKYISYRNADGTTILYRKQSMLNGTPETGAIYTRVDVLGNKITDEYDFNNPMTRSLIQENRALNTKWLTGPTIAERLEESLHTSEKLDHMAFYKEHLKLTSPITSENQLKTRVIPALLQEGKLDPVHAVLLEHFAQLKLPAAYYNLIPSLQVVVKGTGSPNYSLGDNTITLPANGMERTSVTSPMGVKEVLAHELVHWATTIPLAAVTTHPDLAKHVPEHVLNAAKELNSLYEFVKTNKLVPLSRYQMQDVMEFVTGALTNPEFQEELNKTEYSPGKSMFTKVAELLSKLYDAFMTAMGVKVREGSVLDAMMYNMAVLLEHKPSAAFEQQDPEPVRQDKISEELSKPDGRYELFSNTFANEMQRKAIDEIPAFIRSNPEGDLKDRSYVLSGAGGTGKTTIMRKIAEQLDDLHVMYLAPSHNARVELASALGADSSVSTIQSALRMRKNNKASYEKGRDVFEVDEKAPRTGLERARVVVIDESSMVSDDMIDLLKKTLAPNATVIFMGDYAQLPPVEQSNTAWAFREVLPLRGTRLLENMRTSKADIASVLGEYRQSIDNANDQEDRYQLPAVPFAQRASSENVTLLKSPAQLVAAYVDQFIKNPKDPKNAIVISYRNAAKDKLNQAIREQLFGQAAVDSRFVPGDLIIFNSGALANDNKSSDILESVYGTKSAFNMQRGIVEDLRTMQSSPEYGFPEHILTFNIGPEGNNQSVTVKGFDKDTVDKALKAAKYDQASKSMDLSDPILAPLAAKVGKSVRYGTWIDLVSEIKGKTLDIAPGYVVTSHKSQGSTYNHVFVDELDIISTSAASKKDRVHSLYTAVSRTREHLYVMHPYNPDTKTSANIRLNAAVSTVAGGLSNGPFAFRTNQEAAATQQKVNDLFPDIRTELSGVNLKLYAPVKKAEEDRTSQPLDPKISRILDKLYQQRDEVYQATNNIIDRKDRASKLLQVKRITNDIDLIKEQKNLHAIAKVGARQLDWISGSLRKNSLSPTELMTAWRVVNLWSNLFDVLYAQDAANGIEQEIDENLAKVAGDAEKIRTSMYSNKLIPAMITASKDSLTADDFQKKLKDATGFGTYALSLNRVSPQLGQEIDLFMKNAGRRKEADIASMVKRLTALEKKAKAVSPTLFQDMIQTGEKNTTFGLVQRYSTEWYSEMSRLRKVRDASVQSLRDSKALPDDKKAKHIAKAWQKYWDNINKVAVMADVNKLFDEHGNLHDDITAERKRLADALGSEEHADEVITEAQKRYHQYLDDRDAYFDSIDAQRAEGSLTAEEAAQDKSNFEAENSPEVFFKAQTDESLRSNRGDRYVITRPKVTETRFHDPMYKEIMASAAKAEVYNEVTAILKEMKSYLPINVQWKLHDNFLPAVQNHMLTDMSMAELWHTLGKRAMDSISATPYEENRQGTDKIPIQYTAVDPEKLESYSRDIPRILEVFGMMALHYKHFSAIKDVVEMGEAIVKEADRIRRGNPNEGEALTNLVKLIEYSKQHLMFKNARALEGNLGEKIYSANPVENRRKAKQVRDLLAERTALEKELMDPPAGKTIQDINKEIDVVNEKLSKYEGQNIYLSKIGDRLIGINQMKALAFNPFSGFANLSFGIASLATYANGRRDFTMREAMTAMRMMMNSSRKWVTFGADNNDVAQKIFHLMERTGMMSEIVDTQYGDSNLQSRKKKWKKVVDPYSMLRSSDYFMKGSILVAMMLHQKTTVMENGVSKEVPLWDAFDNEGNWKFENKEGWQDNRVEDQVHWEKFRNKSIRVGQIIMGNMDRNSPKLMNKYILGRLVGQFRASWLPEGWAARFEDEKYDKQLDRVIKGRYRTYSDIGLSGSVTILLKQFMGMFSSVDPFTGITRKDGKAVSDSEVDMENMRRNFTGMLWTLTLMGAIMSIKAMIPDNDDDWSKEVAMITLNMMNRLNQDLQFYASPDVANNLIRNAVPAFDVLNDYMKAVAATKKALSSDSYGLDQAALRWTKATPYLNLINKFRYMSSHDLSTISR